MSILYQLSSQVGDRSEESNRAVVLQCLDDPSLLQEIAVGLDNDDGKLVGDCAEVLTMVAEKQPEWIVPFGTKLTKTLSHSSTRARWEAMHALSSIAAISPQTITPVLSKITHLINNDKSTIVRDYAVETVKNYAATSTIAAEKSFAILTNAVIVWDGKHAARGLRGLQSVAFFFPEKRDEIMSIGRKFLDHKKGVVRKAARSLLSSIEY